MIGPAVIVWRVLSRRRALIELRLDVLDVAVGTDAVAEQLLEVLLDVLLQRLPLFLVVPNSFAVRANGEQHLELLDLLAQAEDSLRDLEPGAQLVRVHRLGDEIVRPRLHPGQILLLAAARRDEDEIDVRLAHAGADPAPPPPAAPPRRSRASVSAASAPRRPAPTAPGADLKAWAAPGTASASAPRAAAARASRRCGMVAPKVSRIPSTASAAPASSMVRRKAATSTAGDGPALVSAGWAPRPSTAANRSCALNGFAR